MFWGCSSSESVDCKTRPIINDISWNAVSSIILSLYPWSVPEFEAAVCLRRESVKVFFTLLQRPWEASTTDALNFQTWHKSVALRLQIMKKHDPTQIPTIQAWSKCLCHSSFGSHHALPSVMTLMESKDGRIRNCGLLAVSCQDLEMSLADEA